MITEQIEPLNSLSRVDEVELRLMKFLVESKLKPGDALPKEVDLANAFGVSRTVVREALTRLKVMSLVESVKHKGTIVTHPDVLTNLERVLHPEILDEETLREIFEIRLVLEVGMADLLFARITEGDIQELQAIVGGRLEDASTMFDSDFEVRFHGKLYAISGNQTLRRFQSLLLPVFTYVHENGQLKEITAGLSYVTHGELVEILRHGTPEQFREAMRQHLDHQFQRIL